MARTIEISQGVVALVDDEDYGLVVAAGPWHAMDNGYGNHYVGHKVHRNGKATTERLHQFLTGWPLVDHINGDGLDNRRTNLRMATTRQNAWNSRRPSRNKSGFKGVSWDRVKRKWYAYIRIDGRTRNLGRHRDVEAAARAYDQAAREHFGEFARPNFPRGVS